MGEEDADVWAPVVGEKGERGRTWAGLAARERRERKREWSSGWEGAGPRAWPTRKKGKGKGELGWAKGFGLLLSFFFPFSFLYSNIQHKTYLNSNKFEFKPYTLNTNKKMLQHECTSKLIL
jgi:hypothetical protein